MEPGKPKRIAVVGAGPIGLEAALYGANLGYDVEVFESGRVGGNIRRWGFVTLFSPWRLNHSSLGSPLLTDPPADDAYLTGNEYVSRYLEPLAAAPPLHGRVHEGCVVRHIGREGIGKSDLIGGPRERHPFRLLIDAPEGERIATADVVFDCSGNYGNPRWLGNGNIPAIGERDLRHRIDYTLQDVRGTQRDRFAGKHVLLVGNGYSAITALDALHELDGTRVTWISRKSGRDPQPVVQDDPLPERARLSRLASALAAGTRPAVEYRCGTTIDRIESQGDRFVVGLRSATHDETLRVDRILAHVGCAPDNSIYRELQVHECYATFGSMRLAAALLGDESGDCLAQTSKGPETLIHPEPGFFILGAKSYGLNSRFLIHLGLAQIREAFSTIETRTDLDLHASATGSTRT